MLTSLASGLGLLVAMWFSLGAIHKIRVLLTADASAVPVIVARSWVPAHAQALVALAGLIELTIAAALLANLTIGFGAAAVAMLFYAHELQRLPRGSMCGCFPTARLDVSARAAMFRNLLVSGCCGGAWLWLGQTDARVTSLSLSSMILVTPATSAMMGRVALEALMHSYSKPSR